MSGALTQVVAIGVQDTFLTANAEITFFKIVYRRHTNFAMETVNCTFSGNTDFGKEANVEIPRSGDLVNRMFLRLQLNRVMMQGVAGLSVEERSQYLFAFVREIGNFIIDWIRFEIGGTQIDKHWGHFMSTLHDLTKDVNNNPAYRALVGDVDELTALRCPDSQGYLTYDYTMFIPLMFFCNINTGLALPLLALQYHQVRLWFQFTSFERLIVNTNNLSLSKLNNGNGVFNNASLLVDYIFVDVEERRRIAQTGHEYLIKQLQFTGSQAVTQNPLRVTLQLSHPSQELIWKIISGAYQSRNSPFLCYSNKDDNEYTSGWTAALQYAANNVIRGAVTVGVEVDANTSSEFADLNLSGDDAWNKINVVRTNLYDNTKYSLYTFVAGAGVDDSTSPKTYAEAYWVQEQGTSNDTHSFLYRKSVLVNPNDTKYNLGDYIQQFQIVIYYKELEDDGTGVVGTLTYRADAIDHTITVRDVSVPVSDWTDNRVDQSSSSIGTARDIWAVLSTVSGLLINNKYNPVVDGVLRLNGQDRFQAREGAYFNLIHTYNFHHSTPHDGVNVYSFALHPEQHQPSGTCNFSRIDTVELQCNLYRNAPYSDVSRNPPPLSIVSNASQAYIYCISYNILRVMSGMAGTAYAN